MSDNTPDILFSWELVGATELHPRYRLLNHGIGTGWSLDNTAMGWRIVGPKCHIDGNYPPTDLLNGRAFTDAEKAAEKQILRERSRIRELEEIAERQNERLRRDR